MKNKERLIENYIFGQLSNDDLKRIKQLRNTDPIFAQQLSFITQLKQGLAQLQLSQKLEFLKHLEKEYSLPSHMHPEKKQSIIQMIGKWIDDSKLNLFFLFMYFSFRKA